MEEIHVERSPLILLRYFTASSKEWLSHVLSRTLLHHNLRTYDKLPQNTLSNEIII